MSYERKCISDIISEDINRKMFLPAIQREFVWSTDQVEKLFDSIMGDYPISSFLFWKILEENKKDWDSYEFIRNFDEEKPHNIEADLSGVNNDIYLVLDGQQRLTSLFIGLKGTYRYFHYKWRTANLFLNLFKKPVKNEDNPEELVYQFEFRENNNTDNPDFEFWYAVNRILDFEDAEDAKDDLDNELESFGEDKKSNAKKLVGRLHSRIHTHKLINYYEERTKDYDKVVEIFIRTNTGGEKLEYSDILLSTATAKWKNLNAREEIQNFTDDINNTGNEYSFGKDFVLKGSLYLTEDLPIQYKIKNFTRQNLEKIELNWENIKIRIQDTIKLISRFGFSNKNITSAAALLPIAFYLLKLNKKNFVSSSDKNDVKNQNLIQRWLILALLKNAFGSASDNKLKNSRDSIIKNNGQLYFPANEINKVLGIESKFSDNEIEKLLQTKYKSRYSFSVLSLLYPNRDWKDNKYHEDHIFPKSEFTTSKLRKRGYDEPKIEKYQYYYNTILNIQLLTDSENLEKKAKDFNSWIVTRDKNFKNRHLIPEIKSYEFDSFLHFIEQRRKIILKILELITV